MNQPTQKDCKNRAESLKEVIANLDGVPIFQLSAEWAVVDKIFHCWVTNLISGKIYKMRESCEPVINAKCF